MKQKVSNQAKDWFRQALLDRKQREPEVRPPKDPERSSAVFSSDEQFEGGTNESIQNIEVEELFEQIQHMESRNLTIPTTTNQMEKRRNSSALLPFDNGERKEIKVSANLDGKEAKGFSQAAIEDDIDEKSNRRNSKNFVRLRSKKHSQISKESGALEKKTEGIPVKIKYFELMIKFERLLLGSFSETLSEHINFRDIFLIIILIVWPHVTKKTEKRLLLFRNSKVDI